MKSNVPCCLILKRIDDRSFIGLRKRLSHFYNIHTVPEAFVNNLWYHLFFLKDLIIIVEFAILDGLQQLWSPHCLFLAVNLPFCYAGIYFCFCFFFLCSCILSRNAVHCWNILPSPWCFVSVKTEKQYNSWDCERCKHWLFRSRKD